MSKRRFFFPQLAPLYKRIPFARCLLWQSRFLTEDGARWLAMQVMQEFADALTFTRDGLHWTIPLQDVSVGQNLFMFADFDRSAVARLVQWADKFGHLQRGNVILELGANLGSTTLPLAQLTQCHIAAVEPVPRNLAFLKQNVAQNDLSARVTIVECAASDHNGETEMIVPLIGRGGAEIASRNVERPEAIFHAPCETVPVKTKRLDTLLAELQLAPERVAFVWCDVQGSEGAVIRTGGPLWRAGVPLWAEIAPLLLARQGNVEQFIGNVTQHFCSYVTRTMLETDGFDATPLSVETFRELVARLTGEAQTDVLFLPRQT
ncbi:MAG: FkbM family methyltransferase [Syntrophobacteraceae bacterium]|jgi:FkbM family methyltransferase